MLYTKILVDIGPERFAEVLAGSGRKAKETYFARHGIRHTPQVGKLKLGAGHKTQARVSALFTSLAKTQDEPMGEEILRLFLLSKRPLLALALDHLSIPHEDGLTESEDVARLAALTPIERAELSALALTQGVAADWEVKLYLDYMTANHVREQEAKEAQQG